jgi:pantothenate kinase
VARQHAALTEEQWQRFSRDQQLLMIGNEMNRARKLMDSSRREHLKSCYERVLRLVDLTVRTQQRPTFRRELLRWRDLVARLYVAEESNLEEHDAAFRSLLCFTPATFQQLPLLLPRSG